MRMYLTDFPHFFPASSYEFAIERMVRKLRQLDGVISIFQIGSINSPGISDIDMLVVFEDGTECNLNPLEDLSKSEHYLFSHGLYGVSKTHFREAQRYTFFHNYNLLWGEQLPFGQSDSSGEEMQALKTQTALEYLIKMFINTTVERTYGIVRVRGLLVLVKALSYDLEFLNVSSGRLFDLVQTIINWRNNWFESRPDKQTFKKWFQEFCVTLTTFLEIEFTKQAFYLPECANVYVARNMMIEPSKCFDYVHKGTRLAPTLGVLGKKYFNVQHRFNTFRFRIPVATCGIPNIIRDYFTFARQTKQTNNESLPYFMPLTSSLNILGRCGATTRSLD